MADVVATLGKQVRVREERRQRFRELGGEIDKRRDQIAELQAQVTGKQEEARRAEARAQARRVMGDEEEAEEARREADVLAGEARQLSVNLAALEEELGAMQEAMVSSKADMAALDADLAAVHQDTPLSEVLAVWKKHKDAIEDAIVTALEAHCPALKAEADRLAPVLKDRRRVDKSQWTRGRDGVFNVHAILADVSAVALQRYLKDARQTLEAAKRKGGGG